MKDPIQEWKNKKADTQAAQKKYLTNLRKNKTPKNLDSEADRAHDKVFSKVDCLKCANCCTSIPPIVNKTDTRRIAKHLGMKESEFQKEYLVQDEDGDTVMNVSPCRFLEADNACAIYEVRPKACRAYPHTNRHEFSKNINLHIQNLNYCPAVFHIVEVLRGVEV